MHTLYNQDSNLKQIKVPDYVHVYLNFCNRTCYEPGSGVRRDSNIMHTLYYQDSNLYANQGIGQYVCI